MGVKAAALAVANWAKGVAQQGMAQALSVTQGAASRWLAHAQEGGPNPGVAAKRLGRGHV